MLEIFAFSEIKRVIISPLVKQLTLILFEPRNRIRGQGIIKGYDFEDKNQGDRLPPQINTSANVIHVKGVLQSPLNTIILLFL